MSVRPIDIQVVIAQQVNVAVTEQSQHNMAPQVQAQAMQAQKTPEKVHERETKTDTPAESNSAKIKDGEEAESRRRKKRGRKELKGAAADEPVKAPVKEEGKGVRFDALT